MNETKPLRIGIVVARERSLENWELMVLDRILANPRLELAAVFTHPQAFGHNQTPKLLSWAGHLEARALAAQPTYKPKHFSSRRQFFDCFDADGDRSCSVDKMTEASLRRLKLDLVIRTTPKGIPADAVPALPFGEWAFNFSDQRSAETDWFGYAEVLAKAPTVDVTLYARRGRAVDKLEIARAAFNIKPSAARIRAFVRERSVTLLIRELTRLADTRQFSPQPLANIAEKPAPSVGELLRYGSILAGSVSGKALKAVKTKLHADAAIWTLYTGRGHIADFDPTKAVEIPPSDDSIKADPFLFQHDGQCYLFYEAYSRADHKAHIAVGRFDGDALTHVGIALERPYHLSYPFIFRDGDEIYMIPETHQARRLEIWRCREFPLKWDLHATAFEGQSPADSILIRHADAWWLFTNLSDFHAYEDHCSELYVFQVDGPALTGIRPHKRNPVVIGSTEARGAGRIFTHEGRLLRPSQHNSHGIYGYGLNIMEIDRLTLDDYSERCIRTITPGFKTGLHGCHHFDAADGRYILDARLTI